MRQLFKILLAIGVIAFAVTITAVSCGKTAGGGGNNNTANNSGSGNSGGSGGSGGNNGGGNATCTGICPTTNLVIKPLQAPPAYVKISGSTVTVNANGLAGVITPHSDTDPNNRGFDDAPVGTGGASAQIFGIEYPGAIIEPRAVMFFVNRASVSTNSITLPAAVTTCPSSETTENTRATAGNGTCRVYDAGAMTIGFDNYLGTVFNNTNTANRARGLMYCHTDFFSDDTNIGGHAIITDAVLFNASHNSGCHIAVVNSAGTAAAAEIDDAWVGDTASMTEVELHAIGINVNGKTIEQFSGLKKVDFDKVLNNAAFKRLLQNNPWGELKFKVKIVASTNF